MKASSWPKASKEWTSESIWMVCGIICGMGFVLHCFKLDVLVNLLYTTGVNGKEQSLPKKMPIFQGHWRQPDSGLSDLIWSMSRVGGVGHPRRCPSPLGSEAGWTAARTTPAMANLEVFALSVLTVSVRPPWLMVAAETFHYIANP